MPAKVSPMLATSGKPFDSEQHYFEIKWDGIRALAYRDGEDFWMETRNLKSALPRFPELNGIKRALQARQAVLDGEIVVFGPDGVPDFDAVRSRNAQKSPQAIAQSQRNSPAVYVAFDCLFRDGDDLMSTPLSHRIQHLADILEPSETLMISRGVVGPGTSYFRAAARRGLEGVVGKALTSPYEPGRRTRHWIKVRNVKEADCVIGGFVPKGPRLFKSLLLGLFDMVGRLRYIGHVGTGFSSDENAAIRDTLDRIACHDPPFAAVSNDILRSSRWVSPRLVCSVEYLTLTSEGHLRHPAFKAIRSDKAPQTCRLNVELRESTPIGGVTDA